MGKLDVSVLRYLGSDEFRVLHAIETGMRNHEYVPTHLVGSIAGLQRGGSHKVLKELVRHKLIGYDNRKAEGYRLTVAGYDFLALRAMLRRESIHSVGNQIGVGKESDVYICANSDGLQYALKLHRLGRNSFRTIKKNRDYMKNRKHTSWLYMARLAAAKEYAYMQVLHQHGFPVPVPVDCDRNCIIMELLDATPLSRVQKIDKPGVVYNDLMEIIVKLANYGLVHCDFNEFNLMISPTGKVTMIDFPQMVSTEHSNSEFYFDRDVECIRVYFKKRFGYESKRYPKFQDVVREHTLDVEVAASGFSKSQQEELADFIEQESKEEPNVSENEEESSSEEESESEYEDETNSDNVDSNTQQSLVVVDLEANVETLNTGEGYAAGVPPRPDEKQVVEVLDDKKDKQDTHTVTKPINVAVPTTQRQEGVHSADCGNGSENESDDGDAALKDLATGNRDRRAFRDNCPIDHQVARPRPAPSKSEQDIRDKVKRSLSAKARRRAKSKEKGTVSRENKAKRKPKVTDDW